MHKLAAFVLGCVAGYMLNEYVEVVLGHFDFENALADCEKQAPAVKA